MFVCRDLCVCVCSRALSRAVEAQRWSSWASRDSSESSRLKVEFRVIETGGFYPASVLLSTPIKPANQPANVVSIQA